MAAAEHVDIYDEELKAEEEEAGDFLSAENDALYDDVLTGSVSSEAPLEKQKTKEDNKPEVVYTYKGCTADKSKRFAVYVGNFSWWTSDKDLISVARTLGVKDVVDIKFAENRANGQSRGFAEIVVSTEESVKRLIETMPQCQINGEKVDCRSATRKNLAVFEAQARKRIPQRSNSKTDSDKADSRSSISSPTDLQLPPLPPVFPPPPHITKPPSLLPSFFNPLPPPFPPPHLQAPPLPHLFPPPSPHMPNTHTPPPHIPNTHTPSLHINPAFFPPAHDTHNSSTAYGRHREGDIPAVLTPEGEFEELMNRNRTIASSAITKAMSGATTGDVSMAIETLLTAIAVIKQSRVYSDERCRALVESLKDCLYSIESKSYGSRKRHRSRERDRERVRSRERERDRDRDRESSYGQGWPDGGPSRRHHERSSSMERERDRGRERHREHRERHR
ncbi:cleavage and polyadenylation specificity factor subunit 7-like isoform X2 [Colossoma macropomum]|uniref:cleavage and polyadenylation specificity factor subunit 7-like isoform X2 n=1 Tax=Colossoma macropomum TaxID=42526 RepID=UPI00186434EA|nr:cleavage and polyadenylation specificity factor subunit 7-like isoform X2 [Colossoma macropomum]